MTARNDSATTSPLITVPVADTAQRPRDSGPAATALLAHRPGARLRHSAMRDGHRHDPSVNVKTMLRNLGLRPTQQRMMLVDLLFSKGRRHVTAEMVYEEAGAERCHISLATIYNTLNQLTQAGLLRQVGVDGSKTYFCNNTTDHHHFYLEDRHELVDIPAESMRIGELPTPPDGYEIARVDLVIRLRRKRA